MSCTCPEPITFKVGAPRPDGTHEERTWQMVAFRCPVHGSGAPRDKHDTGDDA